MAKNSIAEIAKEIVAKHGLSQKDAELFVSAVFEQIYDGLSVEDVVKVKGLGTFKVIEVRDRESVNVNTGERVVIEGHNKISFIPDAVMRDFVNKPFAQFETVVINDGVDIEELNSVQENENLSDYDNMDVQEKAEANVDIDDICDKSLSEPVDEPQETVLDTNIVEENCDKTDDIVDLNSPKEVNSSVDDVQEENYERVLSHDEQVSIEGGADNTLTPLLENNACLDEKENTSSDTCFFNRNKWFFVVSIIFVSVVSLLLGYYIGLNHRQKPIVKYVKTYVSQNTGKMSAVNTDVKDSLNKDTIIKDSEKSDIISEEDVSEVKEIVPEEESKTASKPSLDDEAILNTAKAMVRTGAYRILGTDRIVTIKKGETLKKISRFYLGEGMDCYIQVHNGIVEVKEGQKLKIPKLELKKRLVK